MFSFSATIALSSLGHFDEVLMDATPDIDETELPQNARPVAPLSPLPMPNPSRAGAREVVHAGVVVIVGANGSGKSRLGTWIEAPDAINQSTDPPSYTLNKQARAYRVSAQRQLSLPDDAVRLSAAIADEQLKRGSEHGGPANHSSRVNYIDPAVGTLDDFRFLLNAMFARRAELDRDIANQVREGKAPEEISLGKDPISQLDRVWSAVFSERSLHWGDHKVLARSADQGEDYPASRMSDGERTGFYLIAHVLLAPDNMALVLDEPELHLHRSVLSKLWDALEVERRDCTFIYITHDLNFASSRHDAAKVAVYEYAAPTKISPVGFWDWEIVKPSEDIPEDMVLKILGSRRPTLFVEGLSGSRDLAIYEAVFPEFYIIPCGGCSEVRNATQSFAKHYAQHHVLPRGVVDRDDLDEEEISALSRVGVHALSVACVENILLLPECVDAYVEEWLASNPKRLELVSKAQSLALAAMKRVKNSAVSKRAQYRLRYLLGKVAAKGVAREDMVVAVDQCVSSANAGDCYDQAEKLFSAALCEAERSGISPLLKVFRNKALLYEFSSGLRVDVATYQKRIIELLRKDPELVAQVRMSLGIA
ncbi:AAA family ATPase [Xanthomonas sacchari]|uniref:AAA family ATPase n=1 Tax=Xanthomonas TaxID=338 RepID=UPI002435C66B|nr:AAA family ATPase [Xanthomonas sacchari]